MIPIERTTIINDVLIELERAYKKHGKDKWGRHEFYAILKEEVDEVWDGIKQDIPLDEVVKEITQVICVCIRYLETGDRYIQDNNNNKERSKK